MKVLIKIKDYEDILYLDSIQKRPKIPGQGWELRAEHYFSAISQKSAVHHSMSNTAPSIDPKDAKFQKFGSKMKNLF